MTADREAARILAEYERREREIGREFYSLSNPANLFIRQGQERALRAALARAAQLPLTPRRILEVGCGRGQWLRSFESFGAKQHDISGIDLDAVRIREATRQFPDADLRTGDATQLPWPNQHFNIVFQSTMLTSILDPAVRTLVANEMRRVVARDGVIVSYDFRFNNPNNRNVRSLGIRELRDLFSDCELTSERVTLAPPIARRLVHRSWLAAALLENLSWLNTHLMVVIRPR